MHNDSENIAVAVSKISKSFGKTLALNEISFNVRKNEIYGLIGPDGAGKTTMFRILTTLLVPDKGTAHVFGNNVVTDYKKLRQITGYMPGRFSLYQDLSVEENLAFFATVFGTTIDENYHLIKDIYSQIEPFKKRLAGQLSGGMKQKLALSCALIHKPEVLVLDEPTTGVDAVSRKEFWDMLIKLKDAGITILVSTPYMDEAALCDRVSLIQNGSVMKTNTPQNIVKDYDRQLFSVKGKNKSGLVSVLRIFEEAHSAFLFGQDIHFTAKQAEIDRKDIRQYLQKKGFTDVQVEEIKPGIEDCFMELMKVDDEQDKKQETRNPEQAS
jgi:ABC-type multidrug transport system ATPase subunit